MLTYQISYNRKVLGGLSRILYYIMTTPSLSTFLVHPFFRIEVDFLYIGLRLSSITLPTDKKSIGVSLALYCTRSMSALF